jgi:hypothetical protein
MTKFIASKFQVGQSGSLDEARSVGQALLQFEPGFRVLKFCEGYPYRDPPVSR